MPRTKKGGKLRAKEVKDFLNASYDKTPPKHLDGYILDSELSTDTAKVYYNPNTKEAVVAHRGTKGVTDWGNNLAYALGAYEYTPRYKQGKSVQDKAEKKYKKENISTLGHSQGAILARKLGTDTKEVINVNPAYTFEKPKKNEYNIRSSTDVVSGLYAPVAKTREILFPKYSKKHDITIPSQSTFDVLGEHSYDILDRLGEKEIGVGAGNKISSNNIMKAGKRYSRLGYTGEDIDWLGGGVITTNNNNGGVGTPYVNRGTNPYGTRGAGRHYDEIEGGNIDYNTAFGIGLGSLAGSAALYKLTEMIQELINNRQQVHPEAVAEILQDAISAEPVEGDIEEGLPTAEERIAPAEELTFRGGKIKNPFKSVSKAFAPVKKTFDKAGVKLNTGAAKVATAINPMTYALGNKDTRNAMIQSGKITHDYLLPAVVSAGKPIFDATAMVGSTMLTGNPLLGKVAADTVWNEMVTKKGNDPRQNQKSKELGELSTVFGQALAKPYTAALSGGYRLKGGMVDEESDDELTELMGQISFTPTEERYRPSAIPPELKRPVIIRRPVIIDKEVAEVGKRKAEDKAEDKAEGKEKKGKGRRKGEKKGGASNEQIGQAAAMRTYTTKGNQTFYALSDIVHSADRLDANDFSGLFKDLSKTKDDRVEMLLEAFNPSYLRQVFYEIDNGISTGRLDPVFYNDVLRKILRREPNASRTVKGYNDNWGASNPEVQAVYSDIRRINPKAAAAQSRREYKRGFN